MDYDEYVAARRPALVRSAVLLGCTEADAEDVVQTALLRCYRSWRRVRRADQPDAYVYRVLVNVLRDARSRRWTGELATAEVPEPAPAADVAPDVVSGLAVRRALGGLSVQHREVLVLRYYVDLSEQLTADVLGVPVGTVKSRTARALGALAARQELRSLDVC